MDVNYLSTYDGDLTFWKANISLQSLKYNEVHVFYNNNWYNSNVNYALWF